MAISNDELYSSHLRMLKFNLPKEDRVALHKRIASGNLSPATLMSMSSDELASEEEQKKKHVHLMRGVQSQGVSN